MTTEFEARTSQFYDLRNGNTISLNGIKLGGFGETAAVSYEFVNDRAEHMAGADGIVVISNTNDDRLVATLTFMETSKSYAYVYGLYVAQQAAIRAGQRIPTLAYYHEDRINGDRVSAPDAVFITVPGPTKEKTAGEREFTILLPYAGDPFRMQMGPRNLGGLL